MGFFSNKVPDVEKEVKDFNIETYMSEQFVIKLGELPAEEAREFMQKQGDALFDKFQDFLERYGTKERGLGEEEANAVSMAILRDKHKLQDIQNKHPGLPGETLRYAKHLFENGVSINYSPKHKSGA